MSTEPPIVIAHDLKNYRADEIPDEFIQAILDELAIAQAGGYESMEVNADTPDDCSAGHRRDE